MPTQITIDESAEILIELRQGRGTIDVARGNEKELAQKSANAFNSAIATIRDVARRTSSTIRSMKKVDQPDTVEMTFGLKLTSDAKALIVNAGVEAQIEVKFVWHNEDKMADNAG